MAKLEAFCTYCSPDRSPLYVLYQITSDPLLNIPEGLLLSCLVSKQTLKGIDIAFIDGNICPRIEPWTRRLEASTFITAPFLLP